MTELWCVSGPRWTFGLIVEDNIVVEAAPISRWAVGKRIARVCQWWRDKGADRIERVNENGTL